ncbi:hypothetical protein [Rossellomorea marisflavi]|nr:hypothetical protein [Rossellomorea marisflavi]
MQQLLPAVIWVEREWIRYLTFPDDASTMDPIRHAGWRGDI